MIAIDEFKNKITKKSRLIGLDLGSKRIGIAICDDKQSIATPFKTIQKDTLDKLIDELIFYIAPTTLGKNKINFSEFESSFSNIGTIHLELKEINEIGPDIKLITKPIYS